MRYIASVVDDPLVEWSSLIVRTEKGTILRRATMKNVELDLDFWLFQQRTGATTMNERVIITWNTIAANAGVSFDHPSSIGAKDKAKLMSEVEKRLEAWIAGGAARSGLPELDTEFAERAPKVLHAIFDKRGDELGLEALATFYVATSDSSDEVDGVKDKIRALAKHHPDTWSIQLGAAPKVRRLLKPGKKGQQASTGQTPYDNTRKGGGNASGLLRKSKSTEAEFERRSVDWNDATWEQWVSFCHINKIAEPTSDDLIRFSEGR